MLVKPQRKYGTHPLLRQRNLHLPPAVSEPSPLRSGKWCQSEICALNPHLCAAHDRWCAQKQRHPLPLLLSNCDQRQSRFVQQQWRYPTQSQVERRVCWPFVLYSNPPISSKDMGKALLVLSIVNGGESLPLDRC